MGLAEIIAKAKVPSGVFNLVVGTGAEVGSPMVENPGIDAVSFTGSVATGQHVLMAATAIGARVQLEMGGKNPLVILDDANLDNAVAAAIDGAYYSTGQRCTASSRLIVTEGIHKAFLAKMTDAMKSLIVGDARDPRTQIGPVVN